MTIRSWSAFRCAMVASLGKSSSNQGCKLDFLYIEHFGDMEVIREWLPPVSAGNTFISHTAAVFMVFGGVVPYIPQYREILRTKNADGFSTFVCLTLLVANILRIFFWLCVRFELSYLFQSIIMTTVMFLMIRLCIRVRRVQLITTVPLPRKKSLHDLEWKHFWQWTDFRSYLECTFLFTIITGGLVYLLKDVGIFVEFVGLVAVLTEAFLGIPQFYRNFQNKSTAGMSTSMVMLWLFGDVFKTGFAILRDAPAQFALCGLLQVTIDLAVLSQLWLYRNRKPRKASKVLHGVLMNDPHSSQQITQAAISQPTVAPPTRTYNTPVDSPRGSLKGVMPSVPVGSMMAVLGLGSLGSMASADNRDVRVFVDSDYYCRQPHQAQHDDEETDFDIGSGPLKRGFSDTIYDFDGPPQIFVHPHIGDKGLLFDAPLAKEETFSSLELSDESEENKVFDRGESVGDGMTS